MTLENKFLELPRAKTCYANLSFLFVRDRIDIDIDIDIRSIPLFNG